MVKEVDGHDGVGHEAGIVLEPNEASHRGQADDERHEDLVGTPRVFASGPAEGDEHRGSATDEHGVA